MWIIDIVLEVMSPVVYHLVKFFTFGKYPKDFENNRDWWIFVTIVILILLVMLFSFLVL